MRMSEILRTIADAMDSAEPNTTMSRTTPVAVAAPGEEDAATMVPPLQMKLELLKKSAGVDSVYDAEGDAELAAIKANAGLGACGKMEASEDNDITG